MRYIRHISSYVSALVFLVAWFSFLSAEEQLPIAITIDGVMLDQKKPLAIINGEVLTVGDKVQEAEVTQITSDAVRLKYKGKTYTVSVGTGKKPSMPKPAGKNSAAQGSIGAFTSFLKNLLPKIQPASGGLSANPQNDQAMIDKIFNTKVEPDPVKFEHYYSNALHYYSQAESQVRYNKETAFTAYGEAAKAAAWAIQYSPQACAEKHDERGKMFEVLNSSLQLRAQLKG